MDPLRLLSRSTNRSRTKQQNAEPGRPSSGQNSRPQLFTRFENATKSKTSASRKRKRGDGDTSSGAAGVQPFDFFGKSDLHGVQQIQDSDGVINAAQTESTFRATEEIPDRVQFRDLSLSLQDRKKVLGDHKLKFTWLNPRSPITKETRKRKDGVNARSKARHALFPDPLQSFGDLAPRFSVAKRLTANVTEQGFDIPTEVQLGALPLLLGEPATCLEKANLTSVDNVGGTLGIDLLTIAPTGSGKTLAFLIPLLHALRCSKSGESKKEQHTSAIVLAPTRELASQIVNEGRKLAQNTGIRVTQMRKGMRFDPVSAHPDENTGQEPGHDVVVKADIVVSTPGVLQSVFGEGSNLQDMSLVRYLVLDEADVLLDPLFREQTLAIWSHLNNPALRISMWSATMGSNVEALAASTIDARRTRIFKETGVRVSEAPLIRLVVGLKDSAVPNVQHKLIYAATEQGKLTGLRQLLHPATTSIESASSLRPPFLVFTQTIERAIALHSELLYDIPAEAGGIDRIAVLHSDLSDTARDKVMTRFRKGEIWVLITTDLLSRGVDFLGVNGVVNYDIPTSSAAYVHRIGRTGRAGREGGVAVTLYSKEDIPYLKHVATIVAMAHKQGGITSGVDQWLLDVLPKLSKNDKQNMKRRGIESRITRGKVKDPKAARRAKISTKSGYDRRLESRRKGAAVGGQTAKDVEVDSEVGDETDFAGFD